MPTDNPISQLRQRIPIGMLAAKRLLKETGGDLQKAVTIWQDRQAVRLAEKFSIAPSKARPFLEASGFDFEKALVNYQDQLLNQVEKILRTSKDPDAVLVNFYFFIQQRLKKLGFEEAWLSDEALHALPPTIQIVIMTYQWFEYAEIENCYVGQGTTKEVIEFLRTTYQMPELADTMVRFEQDNDFDEGPEPPKDWKEWNVRHAAAQAYYQKYKDPIDVAKEEVYRRMHAFLEEHSGRISQLIDQFL